MDVSNEHLGDNRIIYGKTSGGKELQMVRDRNTSMWKIMFTDGGQIPGELSGLFSRHASAKVAIENYLIKDAATCKEAREAAYREKLAKEKAEKEAAYKAKKEAEKAEKKGKN